MVSERRETKAVMASIRPQYCELIASGRKTLEVRKMRPKISTPFDCYIYCPVNGPVIWKNEKPMNGKVIGEFVCDNIKDYLWDDFIGAEDYDGTIREKAVAGEGTYWIQESECSAMCLSLYNEILPYGNGKTLYGWHISALQIYDKPRELSEFKQCHKCPYGPIERCKEHEFSCDRTYALTRPPQSWFYVEALEKGGAE
jgi:predicted transcriptional regulator